MKKCSRCKEEKGVSLFNKNKQKNDGLSTECVNKYNKVYKNIPQNKIKASQYNKIYRIEKAKEIAIIKNFYVQQHIEEIRIIKKQHYENNKIAYKKRVVQYKKDNPLQYKDYEYKRRPLKKTTVVEKFSIEQVINKYGNKCFYCSDGIFEHLGHHIPLSKGGTHTLENIKSSCKKYNLSKSNKMPEKWLKENG